MPEACSAVKLLA